MTLNNSFQLTCKNGETYRIGPEGLTLGSEDSNSVVLTDPQVARRHARILLAEGRCFVRDERGSGGTFVDGQRIMGQLELHPGDRLQLGSTVFKVTAAKTLPTPPTLRRPADAPAPRARIPAPAPPGATQRRRNTTLVGLGIISIFLMALTQGIVLLSNSSTLTADRQTDTPTQAPRSQTPTLTPTPTNSPSPTPMQTITPLFKAKLSCMDLDQPGDMHEFTVTILGNGPDTLYLEFFPFKPEDLNGFIVSVQIDGQEPQIKRTCPVGFL